MINVKLEHLRDDDRDQFILDTQEAFNYGAMEEFGRRDDHFEEDEQIISRETIEHSIDNGEAYDKDTLALIKYIAEEDKLEKILENQQVIRTPIVRNGKLSTLGYQPDVWKTWE
ncbi:arsenate reductase family protein [Oribacterium sp. NK2B42]|uniref:arsenate reductase family protein n=1 Tax=Oribacterium sp. NK2B42 TaxID=689781 RepID=UPI0004229F78|nr:ArsC/Spx/MgsR family protein [Oribacterium sp. NK2B42]